MKRALLLALAAGCGALPAHPDGGEPSADAGAHIDAGEPDGSVADSGSPALDGGVDAGGFDAGAFDAGPIDGGAVDAGPPNPWADRVISFNPGPGAGFGQNHFPDVVLGPPQGEGASAGSLDVLTLGNGGSIVLALDDLELIDGPGIDLLVFENAFAGFIETGVVAVSDDGTTWHEWPCAATVDGGTQGCAGVTPVYSNPSNGISATDPAVAGGDGFDLAELGVTRARFVRVRDSGANHYQAPSGGFDLDAIAVVNAAAR